jgi:hypothetical protein
MKIIFLANMFFFMAKPLTYEHATYLGHVHTIATSWYLQNKQNNLITQNIINQFTDKFYPESLMIACFCIQKKLEYDKKNISESIIINFLENIYKKINHPQKNLTHNSLFLLTECASYLINIPNLQTAAICYCPEWFDYRSYYLDNVEYKGPNLTYNILLHNSIFDCYPNLSIFKLTDLEILFKIIAIGTNIKKNIIDF